MVSKRIVFWVSFLLSLIFIVMLSIDSFVDYCTLHSWCLLLMTMRVSIGIYLVIFPVIFFFSALTYFMRNEVFLAWLKFAAVYVPLFILTTYSFMMHGPNGGGWAISGGLFLALILFSLLFLFFLISLILIIAKYISLRHKQAQISPQNFPQNQK
jgi:hypothetical protein